MASPPAGPPASDRLRSSCAVVVVAAKLLRSHWGELSDETREDVLDRLAHHAGVVGAVLDDSVQTGGRRSGDQDRIDVLEVAAAISRDRIAELEASALASEAAALVSDARIVELATEVERLLAAQDQATVIDQAKRALMRLMQISEEAAFAVLVAAAQRDGVTLHTVAHRVAASHDESSNT